MLLKVWTVGDAIKSAEERLRHDDIIRTVTHWWLGFARSTQHYDEVRQVEKEAGRTKAVVHMKQGS